MKLIKLPRATKRFWLMTCGSILALIFFEEVCDDVFQDPNVGDFESNVFDRQIAKWVQAFRSPHMNQVMTDLTALGSVSVLVLLFLLLVSILLAYRDHKGIVYLTTIFAGGGFWPLYLKPIFNRPRPDVGEHLVQVSSLSFPSGHSFGATAIYIGLAYYAGQYAQNRTQELFFYFLGAVMIALVGVSRIYLGVHFPTDVLAGLAGGAAWGFAVSAGCEYVTRKPQLI